jgi:hypothetical protein
MKCFYGDQIEDEKADEACSTHKKKVKAYELLDGKPEWKRPLGKPRSKWKLDISMTDLTDSILQSPS